MDGILVPYKNPEDQRARNRRYREEHGAYLRDKARRYYYEHREAKLAYQTQYATENKDQVRTYKASYYQERKVEISDQRKEVYANNRDEILAKQKERAHRFHRNRKKEITNAYGGECACCGEASIEFLSIDHVNGGGGKHRKEIARTSGSNFYTWLKKQGFPLGFRVLCHNCNTSLGSYGYCPHQRLTKIHVAVDVAE